MNLSALFPPLDEYPHCQLRAIEKREYQVGVTNVGLRANLKYEAAKEKQYKG